MARLGWYDCDGCRQVGLERRSFEIQRKRECRCHLEEYNTMVNDCQEVLLFEWLAGMGMVVDPKWRGAIARGAGEVKDPTYNCGTWGTLERRGRKRIAV